jgi:hypothetical protein
MGSNLIQDVVEARRGRLFTNGMSKLTCPDARTPRLYKHSFDRRLGMAADLLYYHGDLDSSKTPVVQTTPRNVRNTSSFS